LTALSPLRLLMAVILLFASAGLGLVAWKAVNPTPVDPAVAAAPAPPPLPARVALLVAPRPLSAGTLLKDEDFAARDFPAAEVPEGAMPANDDGRAELRGALLRRYLDAGAAVTRADVLRPRDRGFLAAVLRSGTRAISVGVDAVTGTAGLIWPGDHVDLILTQELDADAAPLARRVIGETVLAGVRVIAVDQSIAQGAGGAVAPGGPTRGVARTVTLEVTPEGAERVAVAERLGRLSLSVRAMEGAETEPRPGSSPAGSGSAVFGADVSPALSRAGQAVGARMRVIQGDESQEVTFR
jgi:pilus assembly protein CpaB